MTLVKILVTSAWPYINHVPHLGNIVSSILSADVVARYRRLKGDEVVYVTGSDEHGTPIEVEAVRFGIPPKQLTDKIHKETVDLFRRWGISFSNYTRTENPLHIKFVQNLLMKIYNNGYIFSHESELPYCPECDRFLPDRFVEGTCPRCSDDQARGDQCDNCGHLLEPSKLIKPYCTICRSRPVMKRSTHWYFDMPKFTEQLRRYIKNNKYLPNNARNFSLNILDEGLKSRPITRDNKWGIPAPFPGAQNKTIYVWVEAVLGYISATIEYFQNQGQEEEWKEYWFNQNTKTVYFIGKDNIPFHTLILPALLLATQEKYNLPWSIESIEFLMFENEPFSKSRRIGVWIDEALKLFPADYWRYALMAMRPETKDTNFTWKTFIEKVNCDLNDTLGNFIHRTLTFINRYFDNTVPESSKLREQDKRILQSIEEELKKIEQAMEEFRLQGALRHIIGLSHLGNKYLNEQEPWKTIKTDPQAAANTLYVTIQIVKKLAIVIEPVIPFTAEKLWKLLNLPNTIHEQAWNKIGETIPSGHKIIKSTPLFEKIETTEKELHNMLEEIRSNIPTMSA